MQTETDGQSLVVWSLCEFELTFDNPLAPDTSRYEIQIVSAPHARNQNLHAQQGVFTLARDHAATLDDRPDFSPLDTLLDRRYRMAGRSPDLRTRQTVSRRKVELGHARPDVFKPGNQQAVSLHLGCATW